MFDTDGVFVLVRLDFDQIDWLLVNSSFAFSVRSTPIFSKQCIVIATSERYFDVGATFKKNILCLGV